MIRAGLVEDEEEEEEMDYQTRKEAEEEMDRRDHGFQLSKRNDHYDNEGKHHYLV